MADTLIRFSALVTETSNSRDLAVGSGIRELEHQLTRVHYAAYVLALAVSISTWLVAIRAPLWVDETISLFLIKDGFSGIARQMWPDSPAYSYLLLLWTKVMGTSEIMLRVSSILPMLGAVLLLYYSARKLFERDIALIATLIFCVDPITVFAAIDVRPYAFAALATTASIAALVSLRDNNSTWLAMLFGPSAALIVQFHLLFVAILPALLVCFLALKFKQGWGFWRQFNAALVGFTLGILPAIHKFEIMYHTSGTHGFATAPGLKPLVSILTVRGSAAILVLGVLIEKRKRWVPNKGDRWAILLCLSLALVPSLILFGLSRATSMHVFLPRYLLVAVPGIALSWALAASLIDSRTLRWLCSLVLVAVMAAISFSSTRARLHETSWKAALAFVQENASVDNAPVLICSGVSESDHMVMPTGRAIADSAVLTPLMYYKLAVPVVPLPRSLNEEAVRVGSHFLAHQHERFLAMASEYSYPTLEWLSDRARRTNYVHELGVIDGVKILEFVPRDVPDGSR
jgi:Dolichyl-phosphate-mannose-protein mannosyltransferase